MMTAAFVQRQSKNYTMNMSRHGMCSALQIRGTDRHNQHRHIGTPQLTIATAATNSFATKNLASPLSSSCYPTHTLRCYTSSTVVNDYRQTLKMTLLYSNCFTQQRHQPESSITLPLYQQQNRSMGSKSKQSTHQKNKAKQKSFIKKQLVLQKQQKEQQKQQSILGNEDSPNAATATPSSKSGATEQHLEWVEFQKSIEVEGFETGQTLTAIDASKKNHGGKAATKKRLTKRQEMAEKIQERQRLAGGGGGEFPPMRYSDEETERLLAQAYAAIPKRTGPRGTKRLKRMKRRYHLDREIHRKYKQHIMKFHERRMEKRSKKMKEIMDFIKNVAPSAVEHDLEYRNSVRQRYMDNMATAAAIRAAVTSSSASHTTTDTPGSAVETIESHAA